MDIRSAVFVKSAANLAQCPLPNLPEYAFIGRSNVGKSSLINMLVAQQGLAKTSSTPGKTQTINHFLINDGWYLADVPGYGFAKVSKSMRRDWNFMLREYLQGRPNLMNTFVLVDSRLEAQKIDIEFINWLGEAGLPLTIVMTKSDKVGSQKVLLSAAAFNKKLQETWQQAPPLFISSAEEKWGREDILSYIEKVNENFDPSLLPTITAELEDAALRRKAHVKPPVEKIRVAAHTKSVKQQAAAKKKKAKDESPKAKKPKNVNWNKYDPLD